MSCFASPFLAVIAGHSPFEKRAFFRSPYVPAIRAMISRTMAWMPGSSPDLIRGPDRTMPVIAEVR